MDGRELSMTQADIACSHRPALPSTDVTGVIEPAGKHEIFDSASPVFEPCEQATASSLEQLELNGLPRLLLDDN